MGRSGYEEDYFDEPSAWLWRGAVASAIRGTRGQQFLRDLIVALDALPVKRLITDDLEDEAGDVCALGSVGKARGLDMRWIDTYNRERVARVFGIAPAMAAEIMWENDEAAWGKETPEQRWTRVRQWAVDHLAGAGRG